MTRKCVIAGSCNSPHGFPRTEGIRAQWISAVKCSRSDWDATTASSLVCSKHFGPKCFVIDRSCYCNDVGLPMKKKLRPDAIPTVFPEHGSICQSSTLPPKPTAEKCRHHKVKFIAASIISYNTISLVCNLLLKFIIDCL